MNNITKDMITNNQNIRRKSHCGNNYYSLIDFMAYVTNSKIPKVYWKNLKGKHPILQYKVQTFKLLSLDNKYRLTDCASYDNLEYIIQFIPKKSLKENR